MATAQVDAVIRSLHQSVLRQGEAGRTDGELLAAFIDRKDGAAFAAVVRRHGRMVFGVCRRVVGNHHDAEDAFQATFLVLARKAASVRPREQLANWLHGVAFRTALKAIAMTAKRRGREKQVDAPEPEAPQQDQWRDLQPLLDQELHGLPENYRLPILLCDLEGKTIQEAARQLDWPQGTLAGRLSRGRKLLAQRLANRGVALSAGALAALVARNASAAVPPAVVTVTIQAASPCAAGPAAIPVKVAALAEGVLKTMLLTKLKPALAVLVVVTMLGVIGFDIAMGQPKGDPVAPPKQARAKVEDAIVKENPAKADAVAWGEEFDGLQAGLVAEAASCRPGEKLKLTLKLRNVGKAEVSVTYVAPFECWPQITTDTGARVTVYMPPPTFGYSFPIKRTLKPGETVTMYDVGVAVESEDRAKLLGEMPVWTATICVPPGKYKIAYGVFQSHPKLTTGIVDFEVKPATPADAKSEYPTANIVVQYRDETGRAVRDLQQFRVDAAATVARLAAHFPGILGDRGSGPRTSAGKPATFTIKFNHKSGQASQARVAHVTADYATWFWRDNAPYTGDRKVEDQDQLKSLIETLAAKHKVDLK
jgi:RNA polymerase sigma factor (sigma-70 family)